MMTATMTAKPSTRTAPSPATTNFSRRMFAGVFIPVGSGAEAA